MDDDFDPSRYARAPKLDVPSAVARETQKTDEAAVTPDVDVPEVPDSPT